MLLYAVQLKGGSSLTTNIRLTKGEQSLLEDLLRSYNDSRSRDYELHVELLLTNRKSVSGILIGVCETNTLIQLSVDGSMGRPEPKLFKTPISAIVGVYYWHFIQEPRGNGEQTWEETIQVAGLPE